MTQISPHTMCADYTLLSVWEVWRRCGLLRPLCKFLSLGAETEPAPGMLSLKPIGFRGALSDLWTSMEETLGAL